MKAATMGTPNQPGRGAAIAGLLLGLCVLAGCDPAGPGELASPLTFDLPDGKTISFIYVPPGAFYMGSPPDEHGRQEDEALREVTIDKGFYLSVTEITQAQWWAVTGKNPSFLWQLDRPVEHVSWEQCVAYCRKLSELIGRSCRLPTEAEWEYACRAGSQTAFCFEDDSARLGDYAWYQANALPGKTHPVAQKQPNAWGFYDMHGNVREWCADRYRPDAGSTDASSGAHRIVRGGSWGYLADLCRSARREHAAPDKADEYIGLRVLMEAGAAE